MTKEELFEKNTLMAYKIANRYRTNYNGYYEDIKQEALTGLWKACQSYDDTRGCFSTYAYPCISNTINMYIRTLRKHQDHDISINQPVTDELYLEDMLGAEDENIEQLLDSMILDEIKENFDSCFRNERERKVYSLFLEGRRQQEIADELYLSQPVVSRIERRVTNKISNLITV